MEDTIPVSFEQTSLVVKDRGIGMGVDNMKQMLSGLGERKPSETLYKMVGLNKRAARTYRETNEGVAHSDIGLPQSRIPLESRQRFA